MKGFDQAQAHYDNLLPPSYFDEEDVAREQWEGELDLLEVFSVSEMQEIFWEEFADEPWFKERLDKAWAKYCKDCKADDFCERGAA